MSKWVPTQRTNYHTEKPNTQVWIAGFQGLVFRRRYGWSYTVRFELADGTWLQKSAGSNQYYAGEAIAQQACLNSIESLRALLGNAVKVPEWAE